MLTTSNKASIQRLRAYIEARKRGIVAAEKQYDVANAVVLLKELALPLVDPAASICEEGWKTAYLEYFYRDVAAFILGFVNVHLAAALCEADRAQVIDVFFEFGHLPPCICVDALTSQLAATATHNSNAASSQDGQVVAASIAALLEQVLQVPGVVQLMRDLVQHEERAKPGSHVSKLPLISALISLPDVVHNRLERDASRFFRPHGFYNNLVDGLLQALVDKHMQCSVPTVSVIFRAFSDKMIRVGHTACLMQRWLQRRDLYAESCAQIHAMLLRSISESSQAAFFSHFADANQASEQGLTVRSSKYLLLSLLPSDVCTSKQFQFVVTHKLLLAKAIEDFYFLRMLVDVLARCADHEGSCAVLADVFDTVLDRWSQDAFVQAANFALDASICFFLRYAMLKIGPSSEFAEPGRIAKLCKGIQNHMAHSVERNRNLGMRVGETMSTFIAADNRLDFELQDADPLVAFTADPFDFSHGPDLCDHEDEDNSKTTASALEDKSSEDAKKDHKWVVNPDDLVESDEGDSDDEEDESDDEGRDSESDASLDAYDLHDDEEDLQAQPPRYLKDLIDALNAEDDREKTEAALAEASTLLRKRPRDLQHNARAVVTALLRLEDKYSTPDFASLRAQGLAAACVLSPAHSVTYLQSQALEHEQLLQSRIDCLEAMTTAAQELSETGDFKAHTHKALLKEDLDARTMQSMKTRRWGYRRDPLAKPKKNAFADHALAFFSPLLFGYADYVKEHSDSKRMQDLDGLFLAHLLHALARFVECAGSAPPAIPMAKCLMEFAWHHRDHKIPIVRRQVLFSISRVLLAIPPWMLREDPSTNMEMLQWLHKTRQQDSDERCREASRLLLASSAVPAIDLWQT